MKRVLVCAAILICASAQGFAQSANPDAQKQKTNAQKDGRSVTLAAAPNAPRAPFSLPLSFEKNSGQSDARVKFLSRGPGYNLFLTADQAVLALTQGDAANACTKKAINRPCTRAEATAPRKATILHLKMAGADTNAAIDGLDRLPGNTSYFIGNDPRNWHVNVPNFEKVKYSNIYPGIDLIYYGNQQQLESDFMLAPGADPRKIQFEIGGASETRLDTQGNLVLDTEAGEVRLLRPGIYQMLNGSRVNVAGRYVLLAKNRVGFDVSPYDTGKPLVIDPTLVYATFLGGSSLSGDQGYASAVDSSGDAYVTGETSSADFPGTMLYPTTEQSYFFYNTFVSKFNPSGSQLLYSVILGGESFDSGEGGYGIGVDAAGNAYVTGTTDAANFPTVNPFQATFGGGYETAFVTEIANGGASLAYSTFFGGRNSSDSNNGNGIFVDSTGDAYVVGSTTSANFPTVSPMQATLNGYSNAFVAKFNPSGQVIYSTYLGGNSEDYGMAIAVDSSNRAYVTGKTTSNNFPVVPASTAFQTTRPGYTNAFVSRLSADGSSLEYSTYLGGNNMDSAAGDVGMGIAVDSTFNAYVAGQTDSPNFPLLNPIQSAFTAASQLSHAFVTKVNPTGTGLVYSTFLGGEKSDFAYGISLDSSNNAYVAGGTHSTTFPLVKPLQGALAGAQNAFITRVNTAGTAFDYSTYLGGNGTDLANGIAVQASTGNAYVVGTTTSPNFPILGAVQSSLLNSVGNAFVAEISPSTSTTITLFPSSFSFGQVGIGQTSFSEPVTLSNYSGASVTINSISFAGTNPADFAETSTCGTLPAALANGTSCIISVTFSPSVQDLRSATLSVSDTGAGSPHTMAVSGIGTVPEVSLSTTSINFGSDPLNYPTSSGVEITNTGGVPLHISSIQFSGTNASDFTSTSCITTLSPGGACFISVTFTPAAAGPRSATLLINDDAAGSPQTLSLTGTGVAEVLALPTSENFEPEFIGTATYAGDFVLINGSGTTITLANPAIVEAGTNPGDFPITAADTTCQNSIALKPGGTCIVEAKFLPTAGGARSATISFSYTGFAGSPQVVNLSGTGLTGVSIAVNPVNFGSQYVGFTSSGSDQLINATGGAITVSSIAIGGTNPNDFTATLSATCAPGGVIPANTSCPVAGTFTPSALGARSATATISFTGASGSPIVVNLSGTGIPGPVTLSKSSLAFGGQIIGTTSLPQRVILNNLSTLDVHSLNISTGSAVFTLASSSTCVNGATVKAGTSCVMDLVFAPTATGAATATMTVTDDDAGSPRAVALSGVGEPAAVSVSTSTLDFGNQTVGKVSASRAVFLINGGASQITITTPGGVSGTNASDFAIVTGASTTCTTGAHVIGSGGTCSIAVTFNPGASGARTATLSFAASTGGTQTVTLIGTGVLTPNISLSTTYVSFNNQQPTGSTSPTQTVTLTNTGNGPLTLTSIALGGTNAVDFTTAGSTCAVNTPIPAAPGPGNTCTFSIAFAPTETGYLSAQITIISNSGNNPNTNSGISLSGDAVAGGVVVTPASYDFGAVAVNSTSNSEYFTLSNNTATALVPGTITFGGTNAGDFAFPLGPPSCGTLAAFGQCIIYVTFTPKASGARSGQLQIPYTGPTGSPVNVNLTGTGSTVLAFSPSPVVFPSTTLGSYVSPITATLSNGTASNVTLTNSPAITGTNAADFSISYTTCTSGTVILASGGSSCQVSINFAPTAIGTSLTAQLVYTLSAGGPLTLALNGSATGPVMSLAPSPLTFTVPQTVNTQSPTLFVTVSNTGNSTLYISSETLTGANGNDFSFPTYNSCYSIAAGSSCSIPVAFTPFAAGARTGLLTVVPQTPLASQSVVLNGTGQAGTVTVSPTTLTYSSQNVGTTSGSQAVLLKNTSNAQVTLSAVALSGTNAGDYAIATGTTCTSGAKIPALNGTCIVNITFSPTATTNPRTATLTITDNVFGAHPVSLSGTGANPIVSVPSSLTFVTSQLVGTQSAAQGVTLSNFTSAAVTISGTPAISGTNAGDFAIGTNTCTSGTSIPASTGTCTVNITFKPTASGTRTATLTITDTVDANSPHTVTLSGTGIQPVASLGSGSMAFGSVNLGSTSAQQTVTLTNTGSAALNISNVALGGTNAGDFALATPSIGSDCRTVGALAASASCNVAATFTPTALNGRSATITITDDASPTTQTINLGGTGTQPSVSLAPTTIAFGNQRQSTTSTQQTSVLTNSGTGPLTITSVTLGGTNSGDFALATPASGSDCRTIGTVAAGATCTIAATFTPTATGSRSATVSVADSASGSPHTLPLTGTGTFPQATPTPSPVAFGNQRENVASSAMTLTLANGGSDTLHLTTVALGGTNANQFAIASGTTCTNASTVAPGANCVVKLTFTPTALGAQAATITFTDDASPTTQVVNLSGTGVFPQASASPSPVAFGNQRENVTSAAMTLTLANGGSDTLHLTTVVLGGANANQYAIATGTTCVNGGTVAAGSNCLVKLTFTPTSLGAQAATITFTDDASPTTQAVNLTGTGVFPQASPTPATVPFGNQTNGTTSAPQTVTLNNAGSDTLHIATVALGGSNAAAFAIAAGTTCVTSGTVAPGGSCIVNVTFTPSGLSAFSATLTFTDDATPGTQAVNLTGTGVTSTVNFAPTTIAFGNQRQNTTSTQQTSVLSNNGATTLTITSVTLGGTNLGDFALATPASGSDCRTIGTVAAGATCTIAATFTPTATGSRSATVSVADSASGSPHTLPLTGTGTFPQATPTPSPVAFGNQRENVASSAMTLTLANGGSDTLHLTTVALGGTNANQFAIASGTTCTNASTVAPGANCVVKLTFTPTALGAQAATITFTDDASPTTQVVNLSGTGVFPQASASPSPVAFGNQRENVTSAAMTLTLANGGSDTLHLTTVVLGGANANQYAIATGTTCVNGGTVAAGSNCLVKLTFTPTSLGAQAATITFTDDASPTTQAVNLTGTGVFPQASPTPATVPFGNQTNGTTSAPQTVTLNNAGSDTLHIATVALGGSNAAAFAIAAGTTCVTSGTVAPGGSCIVNVTFTPSGLSAFSATLTFTDDATPGTQAVNLTGTGVTSTVNFAPTTIAFGNQRQNTTSTQQTSVLSNNGATTLTITSVTLGGTNLGDFALATPASGSDCRTIGTVAAGATCTIAATFTPTATGSRAATVSVADSATGSPHTLTLSGTGIAPAVSLSTNSVPFANQIIATASAPQTVTLTNTGTDVLHLTTVVLGGTNPADFAIASGTTCNNGATVAAGSTCVLNLTFTPVAANPYTATVTFTDDASPATQTVNLSGTGVTPPTATLSAASIAFGTQRVTTTSAAQSVTITNNGGAPLNITSIVIGGTNASDFTLASPATTCPTSTSGQVAPGANCTMSVTFTPAAINARSASITITVTGITSPSPITLSGTGIAPAVTLAPTTVAFGNQQVSTTSTAQNGTLTNSGTDDLHITAVAITGTNASDFAIVAAGTNCQTGLPKTVAKTTNCTWSVTFTPTGLGPRAASLMFTDDNNAVTGSTQTVPLSGTGTAPMVQLAPTTVTFPPQTVGSTSAAMSGTLTNTGTATLHLTTVAITGTNASDFAIAAGTTCTNGSTVAATNGTCAWNVTFKPTAIGTRTASFTFTDDANPSPQTVPLSGMTVPTATLSTNGPVAFGNQGVGTASAATKVTLTNSGGSTLHLATLAISGANAADFAIAATGTTCTNGSTVAALASCDIMLTFTPAAVNARAGTLTITDDSGGAAGTTQMLSLTGTGIDFTVAVSVPAVPAVAGVPVTATIQITPGSNGFPNAVTFAATNLPPDTTAMFSSPTLTPNGSPATTVLTLTTTKRGSGAPRPGTPTNLPLSGGWIAAALLALLGMVTLRRGIRMQRFAYLPLAVLLLSAAIITGCTSGPTGTPAGSYNVTVTATSGTLSHNTTVAITVQ